MASWWNFILGLGLVVVWITAGVFVTQASLDLTQYKDRSEELHRAYWSLFWAAFVTWGLIALFILLVILAIAGVATLFGSGAGVAVSSSLSKNSGAISSGISWASLGFLIISLVLVGVTGVLAIIAASSIAASDRTEELKEAYNNCVLAAILCATAEGLLIIGGAIYLYWSYRQAQQEKAEREELRQAINRIQMARLQKSMG